MASFARRVLGQKCWTQELGRGRWNGIQHTRCFSITTPRPAKARTCYVAFGSNVGDRLSNIESACHLIDSVHPTTRITRTSGLWETEPMYVQDQDKFLNGVCEVRTTLEPLELLDSLQEIEQRLKRVKVVDKGPRTMDLDILLYEDVRYEDERLSIPHPLMQERGFVLLPLCELVPNTPFHHLNGKTPKELLHHLQNSSPSAPLAAPQFPLTFLSKTLAPIKALDPHRSTLVMSILNMTPDSFSDGGTHNTLDPASLRTAISTMFSEGADIVDIGGESTRPHSQPVSPDEELARILPALTAANSLLADGSLAGAMSVDTYRASTASAALDAGAHIINDVSGGTLDPQILTLAARRNAAVVLGHMRGTPATMNLPRHTTYRTSASQTSVADVVAADLHARVRAAEAAGVRRWRILLDPGFGFAKTLAVDVALLRDFARLRAAAPELRGMPWVAGPSRKRFAQHLVGGGGAAGLTEEEKRWRMDKGTDAALVAAVLGGADVVRVHDARQGSALAHAGDVLWRSR